MTPRRAWLAAAFALLATPLAALPPWSAAPARAQGAAPAPAAAPAGDLLVERREFSFTGYTTRGGAALPAVRVGYQTAGTLNQAGDNAVLITHFFSANGHAFGRLGAGGPLGWWDGLIGPGKPIDTNRFFVVASDSLVNLNAPDRHTITTGPASLNPATGRPWGMGFPAVSIRDFVEVQKRLLDSLGVRRLALVAGPSMGALQAIEWAAAYPEMVERVMPVIGTGEIDAWMLGWLEAWAAPIRMDPAWRNGEYYGQGRDTPVRGLAEALKLVTLHSRDRGWATQQFGRRPAEGQDPARRIQDRFAIDQWLDQAAMARARQSDANSFLYLVRANQLFLNEYESTDAALARSQARWLVVPARGDRVFPIEYSEELAAALRRTGRPVAMAPLGGGQGHLEGVLGMAQAEPAIRDFLAR
ncbi:homoserine O-acetyltransferase [Pseudoroseomonas cervicalis]|uniref:E22 family MetX-like putative esterase n=1 Tax=Teichococcus cervicalis TaxID=204525 RepID=UPI0022F15D3B|nr:homoserine O-acetyltransferase [Pseudoroseomonas cervicalis]WBV44179.1 homoserine O-acetyltransferase [Pseudoroseomonas cervicalis]